MQRLVGLKALPHAQRLRSLGLTTLEFRRLHVDLTWCYKIVFGLVDVARDDFFQLRRSMSTGTRGHAFELYKPSANSSRSRFFASRVINIWNSPPQSTDYRARCYVYGY